MSATIYTNGSTGSKRVQLSNGQMCRRMQYLNNWTTLRIGLRLCFPSAANITGTPRLWVGVGSGTANAIGDATTTNWFGAYFDTATLARGTLVTPAIAYSQGNWLRPVKRVGTTTTAGGSLITSGLTMSLSDTFLSILMVEITKGSPNYTINAGFPSTNSAFNGEALPGVTEAKMDQYMSLPIGFTGIGAVGNPNYVVGTSQAMAMSEAAGNLDCVQIYWDKTAVLCEVESVYHRKLA